MGFREGRRGLRTGPEVRGATRTTDDWLTCRQVQYRAPSGETIDILVLPGEDSAELLGWHDKWFTAFRPAGPAEHFMVQTALRSLVHLRRCRVALAAQETLLIEKTRERWRDGQRQEVARHQAALSRDPDAAVAGLRETALGCLWLIGCWEAFARRVQDARPRDLAELFGLGTCFDAYQERVLEHFATSGSMGPGVDPSSADAPPAGSLARLRAVEQWELHRLRLLYERLTEVSRTAEEAAIAAALEIDAKRPNVLRQLREHQKSFEMAYRFLIEHHDGPPPADLPGLPPAAELGKPARRRRR